MLLLKSSPAGVKVCSEIIQWISNERDMRDPHAEGRGGAVTFWAPRILRKSLGSGGDSAFVC